MAESLIEYMKNKEVIGFESRPVYSRDGDFLTLFLKDEDYYAERIDDLLTVYYSTQSDELIGCKVKGVQGERRATPPRDIGRLRRECGGRRRSVERPLCRGGADLTRAERQISISQQSHAECENPSP